MLNMSDGGGESGKEIERSFTKKKKRGNDEFAQSIAKIAVAQVCESVGFQGFQQSALDTFSDVACRYIKDIGKTANLYANSAGRTESNAFDIIQGLEDLGLSQGFSGASDTNRCLASSGVIREVSQYVGVAEEIAFAYSIPRFPVIKEWEPRLSFVQAGESPPGEHIPPWLPCFPDPVTYMSLPSSSVNEAETRPDKVEQELMEIQPSMVTLQQRLTCNGSELPMTVDPGDVTGKERAADSNPFLAAPLQFGEKEVAFVGLPPKFLEEGAERNLGVGANHVSTLEAFGPAIEVMKNGSWDPEEGSKKFIRNSRPTVQLKFGIDKKLINTSIRHGEKGITGATSWFENDELKDDKKRRAEQILRESMEIGKPTGSNSFVN